ncbi:MAG: ribose 5-phosphate isomerase A [Chloroflexota bacterium]
MMTNLEYVISDTKTLAATAALDLLQNNQVVGLGSGTTSKIFVDLLGERLRNGTLSNIVGVPTSEATRKQASDLGIPLGDLADFDKLDIAIDGADEVDTALNLTKGWGGALVREKLVEIYAERFVIIVDESKIVDRLGTRGPIPVEVVQFGWEAQATWLRETLQCVVQRRMNNDMPYITDNHNFILSCTFPEGIVDPYLVSNYLSNRPGLVGHGLFLDMATDVLVGSDSGIQHLRRTAT